MGVTAQEISQEIPSKSSIKIGGWLLLLGLGVTLGPFRLLLECYQIYSDFNLSDIRLLTNPESEAFIPLFGTLISVEFFINVCSLIATIIMCFLFYKKSKKFPKWYISFMIFMLGVQLIDWWAVTKIMPTEFVDFSNDDLKGILQAFFAVIIWGPYLLFSKRVKATFIR